MYYLPLGILVLVMLGLALGIIDGMMEARRRLKTRAMHAASFSPKA